MGRSDSRERRRSRRDSSDRPRRRGDDDRRRGRDDSRDRRRSDDDRRRGRNDSRDRRRRDDDRRRSRTPPRRHHGRSRSRSGERRAPMRDLPEGVHDALILREKARMARDYSEADRLRMKVRDEGFEVDDKQRTVKGRDGETYVRPNAYNQLRGEGHRRSRSRDSR